jgi:hypothetical protein
MWAQTLKPYVFSYWQTLLHLHHGQGELKETLDLPLEAAAVRAWSTIAWTVISAAAAITSVKSSSFLKIASDIGLWTIAVLPVALLFTIFLAYGIFRLYVLVSHVIAINIFKSRGQRLRWLNQLTTILSLSFPAAISFTIWNQTRWGGPFLVIAVGMYSLILGTWACKLVFHKTTWRGFGFLLGLHTVTIFVLVTCFIAALAALFILGFLAVLIVRTFYM